MAPLVTQRLHRDRPDVGRDLPGELTSILRLLWVAACCGGALQVVAARAASLHCSEAPTTRETTICSDHELSRAEAELDRVYHADLAKLTSVGAASIRADQRAWLKAVDLICRSTSPHDPRNTSQSSTQSCLRLLYGLRVERLRESVVNSGGMTLYDVERVVVGHYPYFNQRDFSVSYDVRYPQFDRPDAGESVWNRSVAQVRDAHLSCRGMSRVLQTYSINIRLLVPGLVWTNEQSIRFNCAPEGTEQSEEDHNFDAVTVLRPTARPAVGENLFLPGTGWAAFLDGAVIASFRKLYDGNGCKLSRLPLEAEHAASRDPTKWAFSY